MILTVTAERADLRETVTRYKLRAADAVALMAMLQRADKQQDLAALLFDGVPHPVITWGAEFLTTGESLEAEVYLRVKAPL